MDKPQEEAKKPTLLGFLKYRFTRELGVQLHVVVVGSGEGVFTGGLDGTGTRGVSLADDGAVAWGRLPVALE